MAQFRGPLANLMFKSVIADLEENQSQAQGVSEGEEEGWTIFDGLMVKYGLEQVLSELKGNLGWLPWPTVL